MRYENLYAMQPPPPPTGHSFVFSMNNKYLWCMCLFVFDQITKPSVDHKRQSWPNRQQPFLAFSLNLGHPVQWWSAIIWMIILPEYEDTLIIRVHKRCLVLNIAPKCQKCPKMPKNAQKCPKVPKSALKDRLKTTHIWSHSEAFAQVRLWRRRRRQRPRNERSRQIVSRR